MQKPCNKTLEKVIERKLVSQVAVLGGCAYKLTNIGARGFPDRTVLYKGAAYFVELKRPVGGVISANQQRECAILKHVGFEVYYLSTLEDVDSFVEMLRKK